MVNVKEVIETAKIEDILSGWVALLFANPWVMLIIGVVSLLFLIVPIIIIWQLKLLTAVALTLFIIIIEFALYQMETFNLKKYPWMSLVLFFLPVGAFLFGYASERYGVFLVTPLSEKPPTYLPPFLAEPLTYISVNLEFLMVIILLFCLTIGLTVLARRRS